MGIFSKKKEEKQKDKEVVASTGEVRAPHAKAAASLPLSD